MSMFARGRERVKLEMMLLFFYVTLKRHNDSRRLLNFLLVVDDNTCLFLPDFQRVVLPIRTYLLTSILTAPFKCELKSTNTGDRHQEQHHGQLFSSVPVTNSPTWDLSSLPTTPRLAQQNGASLPHQEPTINHLKPRASRSTSSSSSNLQPPNNNSHIPTIRAATGQRLVIPCSGNFQQSASRSSTTRYLATGLPSSVRSTTTAATLNNQEISVIVWHKDDQLTSPIFSIDARDAASLREAKQQIRSISLRGRAHFEESITTTAVHGSEHGIVHTYPALVIDEATHQDAGLYTCTVEYNKAATQTHKIRVTLISK